MAGHVRSQGLDEAVVASSKFVRGRACGPCKLHVTFSVDVVVDKLSRWICARLVAAHELYPTHAVVRRYKVERAAAKCCAPHPLRGAVLPLTSVAVIRVFCTDAISCRVYIF